MSELSRETQKRQNRISQKSHINKGAYNSLPGHLNDDTAQGSFVGETPFQPPIMTHLELLSGAAPNAEKAKMLSHLQQSYGNRYVQSLVETIKAKTTSGTIKFDIHRQPEEDELQSQLVQKQPADVEEVIPAPPTEMEEELPESSPTSVATHAPTPLLTNDRVRTKHTEPENADPAHRPLMPMVPVPPGLGACVIVQGVGFDIWINPNEPLCIVEGLIEHEMKHISDFEADPYYSTIPVYGGIPDGETFYYADSDDARKFEHAACDVEMEWLRGQLEGNPSPEDRAIIEHRLNVTVPAYRASFG